MMAGNPSWWSMLPPPSQQPSAAAMISSTPSFFPSHPYLLGSSSSSLPLSSLPADHTQDHLPQSWSQLLLSGLSGDDQDINRFGPGLSHFQSKKLENWEDQILNPSSRVPVAVSADVKQEEISQSTNNLYGHGDHDTDLIHQHQQQLPTTWSQQQQQVVMPVSSPRSCVTSISSSTNILDFSYNNSKAASGDGKNNSNNINQLHADQSSECNSTATGGVCKKARVQPSPSQPPLKVRKEKLGDRITALHQLVSPFGKTDTASVLLEAIGYIRFLQGQIEALSSPYLGTSSSNMRNNQQSLLNDICLKRKAAPNQDMQEKPKDLRSRGLCLVPVSCTQHVGSDNGADYWAPAIGGGF